ncbi:MAG: radical SAM protein [Oscillospiraceae bacterium]|nr:radical SAM protein [Oscillospiraceae bacterium]
MQIFQRGFNYSQDGTGNRLVYHLQGCNLHCPWCSNPEGMEFSGGVSVTVDEIVQQALLCQPMFFDGGGVTFTGGECTCQFELLKKALEKLQQNGISTAIETNGTSPRLPELFPLVDELIMDFKHYDDAVHRQFTGLGNAQVLTNLKAACTTHPRLLVRIPLIGGFNASAKDMEHFAAILSGLDTSHTRFELLCYHEYGKDKWEKCGKPYTVFDAFVSEEDRLRYEDILRGHKLQIVRT